MQSNYKNIILLQMLLTAVTAYLLLTSVCLYRLSDIQKFMSTLNNMYFCFWYLDDSITKIYIILPKPEAELIVPYEIWEIS